MYKQVSANLNFVEREKNIEKFWKENDIFRKSMENRADSEVYTFYDGPPTANGFMNASGNLWGISRTVKIP